MNEHPSHDLMSGVALPELRTILKSHFMFNQPFCVDDICFKIQMLKFRRHKVGPFNGKTAPQ